MASYHRVLGVFGKSVKDKTLECDCDIHPWEIKINGEQWPGKIRLIGFVDVFFLFSYSANARFEKGIIVYKERYDLEKLLQQSDEARAEAGEKTSKEDLENSSEEYSDTSATPETLLSRLPCHESKEGVIQTEVVELGRETPSSSSQSEIQQATDQPTKDDKRLDRLEFGNTTLYKVRSLGHEVGLKNRYPVSSIQEWTIEINKPYHRALRRRIKRAIKEHTTTELLEDVVRCGFISHGQMAGHVLSKYLVGGVLDDTLTKYIEGLAVGNGAGRVPLANQGY
ncbi:uncharacterized protein BO96DRAFT_9438 [Aspergillus niger CBS 101883]|uniref:Uncharacterized protein n=1 Tax=Aspergillus niger ATCC 13496 TaxID=1353008 RepID=A0A370CB55_ASPNG|nr:hypothetical protein ANI_1_2248024 [Aspergillus niger CBS 513.88]XP_025460261.1 uncharacterized protein BO96DRAFT_9438 [Aspergillus niger CBS 101883]PYH62206.1 hypothetical protein BO96DRAFT_9438 [Aspergillus niger CBS 101883]RDH25035.1 hypothetical protein M747DRAFT_291851 [Aspergillus niger ATCC 13496]|eukprot:XP_001399265.2 hypothetical protein ANI_1_2248024 [Aspergillus niger CBS 513.88]